MRPTSSDASQDGSECLVRNSALAPVLQCRFQKPTALILRRPLRKQRASKDAPEGVCNAARYAGSSFEAPSGRLRTRAVGF
jgi:hypothetical protein